MEENSTPKFPQTPPQAPPPQPVVKNSLLIIMSVFVMISVAVAGFFAFQTQKLAKDVSKYQAQLAASPSLTPSASPYSATIASSLPTSTPKAGWKTYKNEQYGFEFSYPLEYKVLTDSENLYGWPKAILLLYKGGQSYDMPLEVWNSEAEYKQKYNTGFDVTVYKKGDKFFTLLNQNKTSEVAEIISTFKFTD